MWSGYGVVIVIESMMDGWRGRDWGSRRGYINIIVNIIVYIRRGRGYMSIYISVSVFISILIIFIIINISIDLFPTLMKRLHRSILIQLLRLVPKM